MTDSAYSELFSSRWKPVQATFPSKHSAMGDNAPKTVVYGLHSAPTDKSTARSNVIVLLHGYPQNLTLWYLFIRELESKYLKILEEYHILIPDLPGYGQSTKEPSRDGSHLANSKRGIAADIVEFVDHVLPETETFIVIGHDRGARVAYRLAKDCRDRVSALCVMDIVPTKYMFKSFSYENNKHAGTLYSHHWILLATESPLPENLIGPSYQFYISHNIKSWTGTRWKGKHEPKAMNSWVQQYRDPKVLEGAIEDYRAGATIDLEHDEQDEKDGKDGVDCPLLAMTCSGLWAKHDVEAIWGAIGRKGGSRIVKVGDEVVGHFLPIEDVKRTTKEVVDWLNVIRNKN